MTTITLKINERSKTGKALKEMIDALAGKSESGVQIVSPYDSKFVEMVKKSAQSKNRTTVNAKNVWESL
jgi:hypothetical protein